MAHSVSHSWQSQNKLQEVQSDLTALCSVAAIDLYVLLRIATCTCRCTNFHFLLFFFFLNHLSLINHSFQVLNFAEKQNLLTC